MKWQPVVEVAVLGLVCWGISKAFKNDAIQDAEDGISRECREALSAKIGPLGGLSRTRLGRISDRLRRRTKTFNQQRSVEE